MPHAHLVFVIISLLCQAALTTASLSNHHQFSYYIQPQSLVVVCEKIHQALYADYSLSPSVDVLVLDLSYYEVQYFFNLRLSFRLACFLFSFFNFLVAEVCLE